MKHPSRITESENECGVCTDIPQTSGIFRIELSLFISTHSFYNAMLPSPTINVKGRNNVFSIC